jgi:hypothetical protein
VEAVRDVVDDMYRTLSAGDTEWLARRLLPNPAALHLLTSRDEPVTGEEMLGIISTRVGELPAQWGARDVSVCEVGEMAFAVDCPTLTFDDGSVLQCKASFVFVREGDTWMLAHSHFSLAAD